MVRAKLWRHRFSNSLWMAGVAYERERVGNRVKQFLFNQISLTKTPEIPHPADSENTAITQFKIKITEIPHKKLTNTAVPQTPMSPSLWFSGGKTSLLPKPGEVTKDKQRPITCLNTLDKWYTSCLLVDASHHLLGYGLMQGNQTGTEQDCSGTIDNLLIDRRPPGRGGPWATGPPGCGGLRAFGPLGCGPAFSKTQEYCLIQLTASFLYDMYLILNTQVKFKISLFPPGNESQIPLIEYSKTTNSTASVVAAISKKIIYIAGERYKIRFVTCSAKAVERAECKKNK